MDAWSKYHKSLENALVRGDATEHTHRPALKALIEDIGKELAAGDFTATNEPKRVECGAPDFTVARTGGPTPLTVGYVETKDVDVSLAQAEKSDQLKRYLKALPNLILTDYLEFRWYLDGELRLSARLGSSKKDGRLAIDKEGRDKVQQLLILFLQHGPEPIRTPKDLALRMARLTHMVRDIVIETFHREKSSRMLTDLRQAFAEILIPDLTEPGKAPEFADMYAQTIAYGLFAARCNHVGPIGSFQRQAAAAEIPKTNPFLRKLFSAITGPDLDDEPYAGFVTDLVSLLSHTDIAAVLEHFGKRTHQQDPVVHFYETFLAAYDPKLREARGVYYTPEPVVSYIVRSVDLLLKDKFGIADGLADASMISYARADDEVGKIEEPCHRALILDPACGTGTFLYSVVDFIREKFMRDDNAGVWSGYVKQNLLPRLFGFELLMAPYAVAHFKLGMQLAAQDLNEGMRQKWAYDFAGDERLNVFLTNTMEEAEAKIQKQMYFLNFLTEEARAARNIKRELPLMVIMGNPPYSNFGMMNKGPWIQDLLKDYKTGLKEKKLNLDDDFIKFIRWAQWRIERTGAGIVAFITSNTYIDGLTHRRMRESLMETFTDIYILDLHGGSIKKETCPDGSKDENVFDIRQGVAIGVFVKTPTPMKKKTLATVHHAELWGLQKLKYSQLLGVDLKKTKWKTLKPKKELFYFIPKRLDFKKEYLDYLEIKSIFNICQNGIQTDRDDLFFDFDKKILSDRITLLLSEPGKDRDFREKYRIENSSSYDILARIKRASFIAGNLQQCLYRPFDQRWLYYSPGLTSRPAWQVMQHLRQGRNIALVGMRQYEYNVPNYCYVFVAGQIAERRVFISNRGAAVFFPLYLYPDPDTNGDLFSNGLARHANINYKAMDDISLRLGMKFIPEGKGDLKKNVGPEDVFNFIYAVFHSSAYRERYAEFLKIDFPRVPLTSNQKLFRKLCSFGEGLVGLHLMEKTGPNLTSFPEPGDNLVETVRYLKGAGLKPASQGAVWINQEQYFRGVPAEVWEFHVGGYQVCQKWLKDRKGRKLDHDDLVHYQRIVSALSETIRIMKQIDGAIDEHGGWPLK